MLELERISVHYGKRPVLREVSLELAEGEVVALVGANAAGKTTTLRAIMGLKELAGGTIRFAMRTSPGSRPPSACGAASPSRPRAARSSPNSPCSRTS